MDMNNATSNFLKNTYKFYTYIHIYIIFLSCLPSTIFLQVLPLPGLTNLSPWRKLAILSPAPSLFITYIYIFELLLKYDIFERFLFSEKLYAVDISQSYGPRWFVTHLKFSKYSMNKNYGIESDQCWFYDLYFGSVPQVIFNWGP